MKTLDLFYVLLILFSCLRMLLWNVTDVNILHPSNKDWALIVWRTNVTWSRKRVGCREYWFWVTVSERWQILLFYIVFELPRIAHISAARCLIEMEFGSKCSILNRQAIYILKNQNWILPTCDSFPLIVWHKLCFCGLFVSHFLYSLCIKCCIKEKLLICTILLPITTASSLHAHFTYLHTELTLPARNGEMMIIPQITRGWIFQY